jgi:60 kDa SS-A/Ro ribonucleoprotein
MSYFFTNAEAEHAEDMLPSMSYAALVRELGRLTALGVIAPESPAAMLVVARLVDRRRVQRSGMTAKELSRALGEYRSGTGWIPVLAVVKALEQAVETARALEDKAKSAAYGAR